MVTTGSSGAFILAFLAMFEPGDRVAVTVPGYPPYRHILTALGCEPVLIETSSETRHALTGEALLAAHRKTPLKGVLVGSPANPTGTMMSREALTGLIAAAEGAGIRFISDEIYHGLDYAFPAVTAAELSPHALVINSFSKYFCMTGWRVGWMVVPEPLVRPIERLQQNLAISVPTLSQIAAEAAFEGREEMEAIKRGYQENRRILIEGLPQAGLTKFLPADGAFYLYADVSAFTSDSFEFAKRDAGKGACRGNPRRRLRSGSWPPVHPLFLCAFGRRNARSRGAHRALARIGAATAATRVVTHTPNNPPHIRRCPCQFTIYPGRRCRQAFSARRVAVAAIAPQGFQACCAAVDPDCAGNGAADAVGQDQSAAALRADDAADVGRADDRRRLWLAARRRDRHGLSGGGGDRIAGVRRAGRRSRAVRGADGRLSRRLCRSQPSSLDGLSERGWDRSMPLLFVAMAARAHHHPRRADWRGWPSA